MVAQDFLCRWIGMRTRRDALFLPGGLGPRKALDSKPLVLVDDRTFLPRGTIRIERLANPASTPQNMLRLSRRDPVSVLLTFRVDPDGPVSLILRRGSDDLLVRLELPACPAGSRMTIQYGWDQDAKLGYFWAEIPSMGVYQIRPIPESLGLSIAELRQIMTDPTSCQISDEVDHVAVAKGLAPAGTLPGLDGAGLVERADGLHVPLETLLSGDEIVAADGHPAQIRWAGSLEVPASGRMAPYRLNAPYHGARNHLILAGTALLRRSGVEVEYLFGETEVAVQVRHLKDNVAILPARQEHDSLSMPLIRYHQLILDRPVPLCLSGVVVETLDFSQMTETPELHFRSILGRLPPEILSREQARRCKILRDYEAQSLRQMQAA